MDAVTSSRPARARTTRLSVSGRLGTDDLETIRAQVRAACNAPAHAEVRLTVEVPSGGDYSGMSLDVGTDDGVDIDYECTWTETAP